MFNMWTPPFTGPFQNATSMAHCEAGGGVHAITVIVGSPPSSRILGKSEGVQLAKQHVDRMAVIHADEASHWDGLYARWEVERINLSEAYSMNDSCANQVESYFSRLREMIQGQHHHVSPQYLHQFATHAAWLEDRRRESNGELIRRLLGLSLAAPVSRQWKGYWQKSAK